MLTTDANLSDKLHNFKIYDKNVKKTKAKTQKKALDEYILMALFVLLLKRVHNLVNEA